jgi:branched-chain amino acid transport system ATP-binding protein
MNDHVLKVQEIDVFYGSSQALFKLSFDVQRGETLALLGRNGAGKSTTMKTIAGVNPTKMGSVELHGKRITGRSAHLIARAGMGYVPEDRQIFPDLSVEDNLIIAIKRGANGEDEWSLERVYDTLPLLGPL